MRDGVLGAEIPPTEKLSEIERIVILCTHTQQNRAMTSDELLRAGDLVAIGKYRTVVSQEFADSLQPGDQVLALSHNGEIRRLPNAVVDLVQHAVNVASLAFTELSLVSDASINLFFQLAADALEDESTFSQLHALVNSTTILRRQEGRL